MTFHDLMLQLAHARYDGEMIHGDRTEAYRLGRINGLTDTDNRPTSLYWALMNDEIEALVRALTGKGLCICGCGGFAKIGRYAFKRCRFVERANRRSRMRSEAVTS